MNVQSRAGFFLISIATIATGCAATYSPPEQAAGSEQCPAGKIWVCRDRYDSKAGPEDEPPEFCMCQSPRSVR